MKTLSLFISFSFFPVVKRYSDRATNADETRRVYVSPKNNAVIFDTTSINVQATDDKGIVCRNLLITNLIPRAYLL